MEAVGNASAQNHWDNTYAGGDQARSWYQAHADSSLELIQGSGSSADSVIDVGAGASTLVDDLLEAGYGDVTALDISAEGTQIARDRLGRSAMGVNWIIADLLTWRPQRTFDVWHDRAVLHFLNTLQNQDIYRQALIAATRPGSRLVIGVFGPEGPTKCSGLDVQRFDRGTMGAFLGSQFAVISSEFRVHLTPGGGTQQFLWTTATRIE